MKKAGILGSGAVAKALAKGFVSIGYEVKMGTGNRSKLEKVPDVAVGSFEEAADFGDIIVLAVKGMIASDLLKKCNVAGKTVIDTTNPISEIPPVNGVIQYFTKQNDSLGAIIQRENPQANIVKAFNSVGNNCMVNPHFGNEKPTMFICGNNDQAKSEVKEILTAFNWETEDLGKIEAAAPIEALCQLWCISGFLENRWNQAFRFLKG
jgi:predicted dinucleotide-binding enzyme